MPIKHIVLSGGGYSIFQTFGTLYHLNTNEFYKIEEIDTIYGTSAGAMVAVCLALKYDWETLNDYIIKRPWKDVFPVKLQNILDAYSKKGIYNDKNIEKVYKPLFDAKDIPLDINLEDFYNLTKVEIHFITFEINEYKMEDISYLTHPKLSVINAIQMSTALPILFKPLCINSKCYVDGGMGCNYPLSFCIESGKLPDEILGIKNKYPDVKNNITDESNILEFLLCFSHKAIFSLNIDKIQPEIANEISCDIEHMTYDIIKETIHNIEFRQRLFEEGIDFAIKFFDKLNISDAKTDKSESVNEDSIENHLEDSIQELNQSSL